MGQRLIDANALFGAIEEMEIIGTMDNENDAAISQSAVLDIVFAAPPVYAVPVVRCLECTFHNEINCPLYYRRNELSDDWFCADGERRTEA